MIARLLAAVRRRRTCRCCSAQCAANPLPMGPGFVARVAELDGAQIRRALDAHDRRSGVRR